MTEVPPPIEGTQIERNFKDIQNDLYNLKDSPDSAKERTLIIERARIVNQAREVGVFETMKRHVLDIQLNNPSLLVSGPLINSINPLRMEDEARGLRGWDDKFDGLLSTYKDGVLRNVQLAYLKKTNGNPTLIAELEREIDLLNWGTPPALVGTMPIEPEMASTKQFGFTARELAQENAKAQGLEPPESILENFREGEEFLKPTTAIVPGSEPRFWTILTDDEKKEWYVRSTLMIAGYKKLMAKGTDYLYMDEMREVAVDLNKTALKRIFQKGGVLPAVGIYTTIIGDEKYRSWRGEKDLYNKDGSPTNINLKKVLFELNDIEKEGLVSDYGEDVFSSLENRANLLRNECADSFYPHDESWGTKIEESSFRALKKSVRHWLTTKGRDLLLKDEEKANRDSFFGLEMVDAYGNKLFETKADLVKELENRARDAEQIAWNFNFVMDTLETFDSREFRPGGTQRLFPSNWWTLFQWVPMHPQERFEAKIKRTLGFDVAIQGNEGDAKTIFNDDLSVGAGSVNAKDEYEILDTKFANGKEWVKITNTVNQGWISKEDVQELRDLEPKELWSTLGAWGVYNLTHGGFRDERGKFKMPEELKVLPDTLIRGPLFTSRYEGKTQESATLFAVLNSIGRDALDKTAPLDKDEIFNRISWKGMGDSPFVPFIFDEMRWADVVTNVFKKGGERDSKVSGKDLVEAVINLKLTKKQRDYILISYLDGVNPKASSITSYDNFLTYRGLVDEFLESNPSYYYSLPA